MVSFTDVKLERDFLFCRALSAFLKGEGSEVVHPEVELTHLRMEQTFEGSVALTETLGEVTTIFGSEGRRIPETEPLSQIIQRLNERFGTDFAPEDRVFYDTIAGKLTQRRDIRRAATANSAENFRLILDKEFERAVVDQLGYPMPWRCPT